MVGTLVIEAPAMHTDTPLDGGCGCRRIRYRLLSRPLFVHAVRKRVALQERSALPNTMISIKKVLSAIPGLELVELDVPVVSTQASHLSVLPKFKAELRQREFHAAAAAGVTTIASVFHACHRELVQFQPDVAFELLNFMELIGESMGIHIPDLYKRLSMMADIDAVIADSADLIAVNGLDLDEVRGALAQDMFSVKRGVAQTTGV